MATEKQYYSLRQVVQSIRTTIEQKYSGTYWVKAEMHKLNRYPSGHCFPELLEKVDGKIVAEMRGNIWAHNFEKINRKFIEVVKEPLKEDTTLLLLTKVSFHETYGLSLQILDIDPNYTLGELQKEKRETLDKLQKLGVLNANQSIPFPILPKRIAIISGDSSKGLSDFMKVLDENIKGYQFFTMLFPAYLQGDHAADSIRNALTKIIKVRDYFDVVVLVRGGGGEIGMSCFNNFELCRDIALFPLPILTGIGHSTNFTVAEMIANKSAITPTELGGVFITSFDIINSEIDEAIVSILARTQEILDRSNKELEISMMDFRYNAVKHVGLSNKELSKLSYGVLSSVRIVQLNSKNCLHRTFQNIEHQVDIVLKEQNKEIFDGQKALIRLFNQTIVDRSRDLEKTQHVVKLMDPINVLKRGYTMTTINGKLVNKRQIRNGDVLETRTDKSVIYSEVVKQEKYE